MHAVVRIVLGVAAAVAFLGGIALVTLGGTAAAVGGAQLLIGAIVVTLALAFERSRYRSQAAERRADPAGPGGGEPPGGSAFDARFRPTDEVFIDPTSGRRMRVFADPHTGERRYRAEG